MKVIYKPKGKAGEYAEYAVNFYNGCSNACEYCYLKRGVLAPVMGMNHPVLQKKYRDESHALDSFKHDIIKYRHLLKDSVLFFTFSSDPCLDETWELNADAICFAIENDIHCTFLTKCGNNAIKMVHYVHSKVVSAPFFLSCGFTLTGADEKEPFADSTELRLQAMRWLYESGFKTWASIEPVIYTWRSYPIMAEAQSFCNFFKVGLMSGVPVSYYDETLNDLFKLIRDNIKRPVYLKDSFVQRMGVDRKLLSFPFVEKNYGIT